MKKFFLMLLAISTHFFASDELNIDSLFKKQLGLRSITSFSLLSTGNANTYALYPNISIQGDTTIWKDTKQISLNQTFIYTLTPKFDALVSSGGSYARREYTNAFNNKYTYNVFYTLVGSNKFYEAYTKKSRDLANFYQFIAKHTLDSKRY